MKLPCNAQVGKRRSVMMAILKIAYNAQILPHIILLATPVLSVGDGLCEPCSWSCMCFLTVTDG